MSIPGSIRSHRIRWRYRFHRVLCGLLFWSVVGITGAYGQDEPPRLSAEVVGMQRALRTTPPAVQALRRPAAGAYDVIALRVEFQPDTTRFTTGTGIFEGPLFDTLSTVDPLPHDAGYFQAHLDFLSDYVAEASNGQTQVRTHLLPGIVRVSQRMGAYSPTGPNADTDAELTKLAALIDEAWRLADAQIDFLTAGFDPERTVFMLFHAGVGRDVELTGTTFDRTPEDLPSLYFDTAALQRLLGGPLPQFEGLSVGHTLILPRTETRQAFDFINDEPFLAELSINGLMAASFFNYLGVPDLFDTAAGQSAIGPFGLMDPFGFFAYNGLFPPLPSAWTRYYLGWEEPVVLSSDEPVTQELDAATLETGVSVARVPISDAEYFLVENRHRDPEGDGLVMRVWRDGQIYEQRVQNGDSTFNSFDISGFIGGVVVGVDNYDWALPGGLDEDDNELNGGLLIWHVDERVIAAGLADNSVNADPDRRGLDLEEADGAQDLGYPSSNPFGPEFDRGSPFDFWYEGNPVSVITQSGQEVRLYENRFGPTTYPSSHSNAGGPSFLVLEDFSAPAPTMSFTVRRDVEQGLSTDPTWDGRQTDTQLHPNTQTYPGGSLMWWPGVDELVLIVRSGLGPDVSDSYIWGGNEQNTSVIRGWWVGPLVHDHHLLGLGIEADESVSLSVVESITAPGGSESRRITLPDPIQNTTFANPLAMHDDAWLAVAQTEQGGRVVSFDFDEETAQLIDTAPVADVHSLALAPDGVAVAGPDGVVAGEHQWTLSGAMANTFGQLVVGEDASGLIAAVPALDTDELLILLADGTVERGDLAGYLPDVDAEVEQNHYPVLADLDDDGRLDVLTTYGPYLVAFTQSGALVKGFPIDLPAASVAQPLVARLTDSGAWSVLVAALDGYLYAFDLGVRGEPVAGFPLAVGGRITATPLVVDDRLLAVSEEGMVRAWRFAEAPEVWWGQLYHDAQNTSFVRLETEAPPPSQPLALLNEAETYNWPNPIREGSTHFRFLTGADGHADVKIVDLAGSLIDEVRVDNVRSGVPKEVVWQTDAPSGVYFARVTFTATDGRSATQIIKMAIVR